MSDEAGPRCSVCGGLAPEATPVAGVGGVCLGCMLGGRFLGSTGAPRLQAAAEQALPQSPGALALAAAALERAEGLEGARRFEEARAVLLDELRRHLDGHRPLLAAHLAFRALRLPGPSADVYLWLGRAARLMDCTREAAQHLKTAGWLAHKFGDHALVETVVAELEPLAPEDDWLPRARAWLGPQGTEAQPAPTPAVAASPQARCGFCGRPASEAGALVEGPAAAICTACLARLSGRQRPS